jgi:hypothetical protein
MSSPAQSSPEPGSSAEFALDVERVLESFAMRVVLSISIIVSLLPLSWAEQLDPLFLLIFGSEFLLRLLILAVAPSRGAVDTGLTGDRVGLPTESKHSRAGALLLLTVDFIALVSFIPIKVGADGARWLRVFRLTRMLLLVGYWAPLVRDLWSIMARGERARQIMLMAVVVGGLSFAGAVFVHHLGAGLIDADGDGSVTAKDQSFWSLLWWAFRQVQDPGNLLQSPAVVPLLIVSMSLTLFGLFLVSFLIGLGTDVVAELLELSRLRPAGLRQHTVVVGVNPSTPRLLTEVMRYYRKLIPSEAKLLSVSWFRDLKRRGFRLSRYLVVGRSEEPPEFLRQPGMTRIVYRQHSDQDDVLVARADLLSARRVLLLADAGEPNPDHHTIQTLVTLVERMDAAGEAASRRRQPDLRERVIIAEILDESNVGAAKAALRGRDESMRAFVVPTERLLALFIAGVVRRPGLGALLEELLTSSGHELYTCFFDAPGLGFRLSQAPKLPSRPSEALAALVRRGLQMSDGTAIVPLGLLTPCADDNDPRDFEVCVNPGPDVASGPYLGFVAVADGFGAVRDFADGLLRTPVGGDPQLVPGEGDGNDAPPPEAFRRSPHTPVDQVLVCGFRPGTIYVLEELLRGNPGAQVLLLLADEEEEQRARFEIGAHSALVARGLMPPMHAAFEPADDGTFVVRGPEASSDPPRIHLAVADWVASRHLVDLPCGFGHVADLDVIILMSNDSSDARTTTALLKLESLLATAGAPTGKPRVVAEVGDGRLAARLQQHCEKVGKHHMRIYSTQQLRAFFLFQSVVVPGFDAVYSELLGSWGQSFVRVLPKTKLTGRCTFAELSMSLWTVGQLLIGVELYDEGGNRHLAVAPAAKERGHDIDLSLLRCAWVVAVDRTRTAKRESHSTLLDPPAAQ